MADITVKKVEDFEAVGHGTFRRARAGLGVSSFGMQVQEYPTNFAQYPEHDHAADGMEEVYTVLSGSATLIVAGEEHRLEPGVFARVGAGEKRKIVTGDAPVRILSLGSTPGKTYEAPAYTEEGAPLPGE